MGYICRVNRPNVDQVGSFASIACAIHCVATGLLLGVLSSVGFGFLHEPIVEFGFVGFALLAGVWGGISGFKKHGNARIIVFLVIGLSAILAAHRFERAWMLSVVGGTSLVTFHVLNQRLTRRCSSAYIEKSP